MNEKAAGWVSVASRDLLLSLLPPRDLPRFERIPRSVRALPEAPLRPGR